MTDFVAREFLGDPARRWQWMVHAVYVAKSQIRDIPLAFSYAALLRQQAEKFPQIPEVMMVRKSKCFQLKFPYSHNSLNC